MTTRQLIITQSAPAGPPVTFGLLGDAQTTRTSGSGAGGWQMVDRPWRAATTEWIDYSSWQLTMSLILDSFPNPTSIEDTIHYVESWEVPPAGSTPPLPPRLLVSGPVPHNDVTWVVYSTTWKAAIRDPLSGARQQQTLDMVLWQYLPPTIALINQSPASAANSGINSGNFTYTVKTGDTLPSIAAAVYGNWQMWVQIAQLNGIRDPNTLTVGQVLQMPATNATTSALDALATANPQSVLFPG